MEKIIERSALVAFSAQQMFDLVDDITRYPHFMDGCVDSEELLRTDELVEARLCLQKGKIKQSFVTRNQLFPNSRIEMKLVEGPFRILEGVWEFEQLGDVGCKVSLRLVFEFKNKILDLTASPWFESIGGQLVDAICKRAEFLYSAA
ncbi:type II toxin-antitoxin system RatA family toxin [Aurantivibrio infirmus]